MNGAGVITHVGECSRYLFLVRKLAIRKCILDGKDPFKERVFIAVPKWGAAIAVGKINAYGMVELLGETGEDLTGRLMLVRQALNERLVVGREDGLDSLWRQRDGVRHAGMSLMQRNDGSEMLVTLLPQRVGGALRQKVA